MEKEGFSGARLHHIAKGTPDVKRLVAFYQEILGFERMENPDFGGLEVVWLKLGQALSLHLIKSDPNSSSSIPTHCMKPMDLPRAHHLCFSIPNFDSFMDTLKERGIEFHHQTRADGIKQVFFFDPDGNGLEVCSEVVSL
ncbi:methylmalonyl-CoA epimerase, mitochondrial [Amborella trichopoda]|uniref:methylmalonyl-CoA epimerase, mitochondrial n=1 Tax=Amborella trichopoda TaxID=13333 RepID=UPI0005D401BD|nr:methylmalonyl-CoA epimerase, mitochondrial [Amborella trichopoda]|eukprot:XP_006826272.2 methylmalonyl-CoA epimerase, mitochondrial [Amborella trichopoda]